MQSAQPSLRGYPIDTFLLRESRAVVVPLRTSFSSWLRRMTDSAWTLPDSARAQPRRQSPDQWGRVALLGSGRSQGRMS